MSVSSAASGRGRSTVEEATWQARSGWRRPIMLAGSALLLLGIASLWTDVEPVGLLAQHGLRARAAALRRGEAQLGGAAAGTREAVSRLQSKLRVLRATQIRGRSEPAAITVRPTGVPGVDATPAVVSKFAAKYMADEEAQLRAYQREKDAEERQDMQYVKAEAQYREKRAEALMEQSARFREERSGEITPPPPLPPAKYHKLAPWEHLAPGAPHRKVPEWTKQLEAQVEGMKDLGPDPWRTTIRGTSNPRGSSPWMRNGLQSRRVPNPLQ